MRNPSSRSPAELALAFGSRGAALASALLVVGIVAFLLRESWPALREVGWQRMLLDAVWLPTADASEGRFGMAAMLVGTLAATGLATFLAAPTGLLLAIFLRFYAPALAATPLRRLVELLAGVPSVVFGLWGLVSLVPWIRAIEAPGTSLLAAGIVLALMVLPTMTLSVDAAIEAMWPTLRPSALALGLSRATILRRLVLPALRPAILTGALLQTARALGETMAVVMVAGNVVEIPANLFDPFRTLTANIALEMAYAIDLHRSSLFASGTLLLFVVLGFVLLSLRVEARDV